VRAALLFAAFLLAASAPAQTVTLVDMVPRSLSNETERDAEPSVAVDPASPRRIAVSAFTPDPLGSGLGPLYVSLDGGATWELRTALPGGKPHDVSVRFAGASGILYASVLRGDQEGELNILRKDDFTTNAAATVLTSRANVDQPWIEAATATASDRIYVGSNSPAPTSAAVDQSLDAATAPPPSGLSSTGLGGAAPAGYAPSVRPAVHPDGVVYLAFLRFMDWSGQYPTGDVVVVRDDHWGGGSPPYRMLMTGTTPGVAVVSGRTIPYLASLGKQRVGSALAIAVDPRNHDTVHVAWGDGASGPEQTLHLRRSADGGATWTGDLRAIPAATNPCLAVNAQGTLGFLYQMWKNGWWETHFELGAANLVLANVPDAAGTYIGTNPLGDYANAVAVGPTFYGVFSAFNTPDPAHFPLGVRFQRNVDPARKKLRDLGNKNDVAESIDPFFFTARP
jgi:hypothetical protein